MHNIKIQNAPGKSNFRFKLINFYDIEPVLDEQWTIEGLLPARGLAVVYGPPSCGKSFLVLDVAMHIAAGFDYSEREVRPGLVVYIAAEGQGGFANRVEAAKCKFEFSVTMEYAQFWDPVRFELLTLPPDLGRADGDAEELIDAIKAQLNGQCPAVVVIDTLSRVMAGGDENGEGMAAFIGNAGLIAEAFDCLVVAVHHTGKDEGRGMRGWSGLHGAADCEWAVLDENGRRTVTVAKMKDGRDGLSWGFALEEQQVGIGSNGKAVTSCIVELTSEPMIQSAGTGPKAKTERKSRSQSEFDEAFSEALTDCGQDYYVDGDLHALVQAVRVEQVRPYFTRRWAVDEQDKRKQQQKRSDAYRAIIKKLPRRYRTRIAGEVEWIWRLPG